MRGKKRNEFIFSRKGLNKMKSEWGEEDRTFFGDASNFVSYPWMKKKVQISKLQKMFDCGENQALFLYRNGIYALPKYYKSYLPDGMKPIAMDIYFNREIFVVDKDKKDLDFPKIRTAVDERGFEVKKIRTCLLEYSTLREACLDFKLPVWSPSNKKDLNSALKTIRTRVNVVSGDYYELWFRGQVKEFPTELSRTKEIKKWLGYSTQAKDISLMPSLARLALKNPQARGEDWAQFGPLMRWEKPILAWILLCNPSWFKKPNYMKKIRAAVKTEDIRAFSKITYDLRNDPFIAEEADHTFQWYWPSLSKTSVMLLCQHYGMPTTGIDVTSDIETSVFFALNYFNSSTRKFKSLNCNERKEAVIYLFAGSRRSGSSRQVIWTSRDLVQSPLTVPSRVESQNCGLVIGSTQQGWNLPTDLLVGKINLKEYENDSAKSAEDLIPSRDEDSLYDLLLDCKPELKELTRYGY